MMIAQGFGNVGSVTANLLHQSGYKIVAVSDVYGGIHNPKGIDIPRLLAWLSEHGKVEGFPGTEIVTNKELLEIECDVLVPAALGGVITAANADKLNCKIIVEGANGPTTPEADMMLHDRGIPVIPDILANAGGVTVSYFEWVQNQTGFYWELEEVQEKLQKIMEKATISVWETMTEYKCDMRTAAYVEALKKLSGAIEAHGTRYYFNLP